ncbi:C4-dicarboxylate transporter DctA [Noviherbaspirillum pedocola]|uniref:C4-dicarboxylate transporter DctA n=1 Tax=Noviherbaspirillum pedocola TaxID=2801341 RepID=A0A934T090_9BURK|nr:C4-dicarboxylate transporter DctA [Noviherbaspirillum pedocola]MBK4738590.1 C4-dicarboxylate transporter DctA [Noviherbaspirillum pedocola]
MPLHKSLYFQVLLAAAAGIAVGRFWPEYAVALRPLGDAFVKLMKMMIAPIVFSTMVLGIAGMEDMKGFGKTLARAMGLFCLLTCIALGTGLAAVLILRPGAGMHVDPATLDAGIATRYVNPDAPHGLVAFLMQIIPHSFVGAFANGEVLPVLLLAGLTGLAIPRSGLGGKATMEALASFSHVLFAAFGYLLKLAPLGTFGAIAFTIGRYGIGSIASLGLLIFTFYLACLLFVLVVLGTLARLHRFSMFKLLRYFGEEIVIVLGTSSSESVLPQMLTKLERLGCRKGVSRLVLPLGYSFNLDGSAIYLTLATMFIAQACDIHLSAGRMLAMLAVMLLTSKGAAGVSGSGFVALVATLSTMPDIPVAGVALIVGIDRFMSEARALTSVVSNAVASIVVSIWEGACDRAMLASELDRGSVREG